MIFKLDYRLKSRLHYLVIQMHAHSILDLKWNEWIFVTICTLFMIKLGFSITILVFS